MGGLGGHMAHMSEDLELTFNDIVSILGNVASADIEAVTEKVDGQNLFLTVDESGEIRAARNSGDIKKGGMSTAEYASKWAGHPAESAFTNGFAAVSAALRRLSPETLSDIFAGGDRYVNMEIMYPGNPNIILYSAPQIVLHGLKYFGPLALKDRSELSDDERAELRDLATASAGGFPHLVKAVDGGQEQIGEELWTVNGPKIVALNKLANGTALAEVTEKIQSFAAPVGMDAQLRDYVELKVRNYATQVGLPEDRLEGLLKLMIDREGATDEGITVNSLKKGLPTELKSVVSTLGATTKSRKYIATILHPIEIAISDFAIEVLRGLKSYFVDEHDEEVIRMRDELQKSIVHLKALQSAGDENMGALIDKQLAKLGDIENLASTMEGVVFEYPVGSGSIYKLTGAFAMANQIIGRARRTGMTEELGNEFSIKVSRDRQVSKPLSEWLKEIEEAKHQYTKLPRSVYEDIMNGSAIVDIVEENNAMPTVYNTILTYVNGLNEEEVELDIVDAEVADPEGTAAGTDVVALVPGAFKPPHRGHLEMVEKYAQDATKVIVLISDPLLSSRTLEDGTVINASHAKSMWDLLTNHLSNVTVGIYKDPEVRSPMGAAYALAGPPQDREAAMAKVVADPPIEPIKPGSEIILGASTKGGDEKRWSGAEKYVGGGPGGDLVLRDPAVTAKEPTQHSTEYMRILSVSPLKEEMPSVVKGKNPMDFHASDMRYLLSKASEDAEAVELLEDFVGGPKTVKEFLTILGIRSGSSEPELEAPLEEMSAQGVAGGGAVEGGAGGIGPLHRSGSDKPAKRAKKKKKKAKQKEYIDLSLVDEVLELLIKRGIIL